MPELSSYLLPILLQKQQLPESDTSCFQLEVAHSLSVDQVRTSDLYLNYGAVSEVVMNLKVFCIILFEKYTV